MAFTRYSPAPNLSPAIAERPTHQSEELPDSDVAMDSEVATQALRHVPLAAVDPYPRPGESFQGFDITSELGRGSMGRVFLARQRSMASRTIVLKVGQHLSSECEKLAKLQHPNVVPVYSFHPDGRMQAVCMPYRGPLTLAHLVARLKSENLETLSGKALTTVIHECRKVREPSVVAATAGEPVDREAPPATEEEATQLRTRTDRLFPGLRGLSYVDAVLTIMRQVTEGLRFAHSERIVHADLKPANVLIADDGCPQLIDFGIAYDKSNCNAELRIGGTRPYMSPEQLTSFIHEQVEYDERSDLYAVGVILYELVTGVLPFEANFDASTTALENDRSNRFALPPTPRSINPRVPAAVEAIIGKCLAPAVSERYQTAAQLLEDLDRQIARRALRFAPNPSTRELAVKWATRNRHLVAASVVLAALGGTAYGFSQRDVRRAEQVARLEAAAAGEPFGVDLRDAEFLFGMTAGDPGYRERAWKSGHVALDRFGAGDDEHWFERPEYQSLPPERLESYRQKSAGLMLLLANSRAEQAGRTPDAAARGDLLRQAADWNRRAEATHPSADGCRAVWVQRGYIARLNGDRAGAERLARLADAIPRGVVDAVLEGRQFMTEGRMQAALKVLTEATQADPRNFWAMFYSSVCQQMLGQDRESSAGYDICASLQPGFFGTYFNRAQVRLRLGRAADAEADLDRAIEARADWGDAYFQRGLAREIQKRYPEAIADLNRAMELGYTPTSVYLLRSRVHGRMNDLKAAERDFAEGIKVVPTDERGWLSRAQAQLFRDPAGALADYEEALELNPRLIAALQGKAHLLSRTGKNADSAEVLTRIIDINPDSPDAWSGRGVLRARLNDRDGAVADAREALRLTERPGTKYQVAGIYAMSALTQPEDRREAFSLLDAALRDGFGFEYLKDDRELDPIRKDPEFQKTVDAARAYRDSLKKQD